MNLFIEGLQGSGKSTLVQQLADRHQDYSPFREGDYSPVELAWCAWMSRAEYEQALEKYAPLRKAIEEKTVMEGAHRVMCYTQVRTENRGFYQDMERYEIYNGRKTWEEFTGIILSRFHVWQGQNQIFECSIFQNIVEEMILYRVMLDDEIIDFYRRIREALAGKEYRILYLKADDVKGNIDHIRKERSDENGQELWFPMMMQYFDHCPYALAKHQLGEDALIAHLCHRQRLELRLLEEVFADKAVILTSKAVDLSSIDIG